MPSLFVCVICSLKTEFLLVLMESEKALVTQLSSTLCKPMDCSPPSSSVHGILQARILKWIAVLCSRRSSQSRDSTLVSRIASGSAASEPPWKPNFNQMSLDLSYLSLFQFLNLLSPSGGEPWPLVVWGTSNSCLSARVMQRNWVSVAHSYNMLNDNDDDFPCSFYFCLSHFPIVLLVLLRFPYLWSKLGKSLKYTQFSSVPQSCLARGHRTGKGPMNRSTPGLPVHHQLLEFTQTHVHQVGDAIQASHPLLSPSPPAPNRGLFQWVNCSHEVAKILEFQLQHQSFQRNPRTDLLQDGLDGSPCSPRDSQESSPTPQFKSISSLALSFLHSETLTSIHDHWKNHSLG